MEIFKSGMKAPIATDWITASDINGTGTSVISSAAIQLNFGDLPNFTDLVVEVDFSMAKTGGDGGANAGANAWVKFTYTQGGTTVLDNTPSPDFYTGNQYESNSTARNKRVLLKPTVVQGGWFGGQVILLYVRANGTNADTVFTISDIKARLIYTPL